MALSLKEAKYLLLCDFDGTLFDGMNPKAEALHNTFSVFFPHLEGKGKAILKSFFDHGGRSTEEIIQGTANRMNVTLDEALLTKMRDHQLKMERKFVEEKGRFFEDTRELQELENHDVAVAITTSGEQPLLHELVNRENHQSVFSFIGGRAFGWEERTGRQFRKGLPHLDFIKKWRRNRPEIPVFYYGDTVKDLETGVQLNARKIFMREGTMTRAQILKAARERGLQNHVIVVKHSDEVVAHMKRFVRE